MTSRATTTAEFRAAIGAGNYGAAERLLGELRAEVDAVWPAASAEQRQSMAGEVLALLKWARQTTLVKRSHLQKRLHEMNRHSAYLPAQRLRSGLVEFDG